MLINQGGEKEMKGIVRLCYVVHMSLPASPPSICNQLYSVCSKITVSAYKHSGVCHRPAVFWSMTACLFFFSPEAAWGGPKARSSQ